MHNITELSMGKRSKAQDRPVDSNGTEYKKFIYNGFRFHIATNL